jgi:hypothetical protein
MIQKYDVVVARYNENLDWLKDLDENKFSIKVYNKGEENVDLIFRKLENLGRDANTFVTYIVENYSNLPEYVIFLQGDPIAHCKDAIQIIRNHTAEDYVCLSDNLIEEGPDSWYENLVEINPDLSGPNMSRFSLKETSISILGEETPGLYKFAAGQQYIVNKKYILNRTLDFYENILERFKIDFVLPWHLERMWFTIFKF